MGARPAKAEPALTALARSSGGGGTENGSKAHRYVKFAGSGDSVLNGARFLAGVDAEDVGMVPA
jgi:hypothetical protein